VRKLADVCAAVGVEIVPTSVSPGPGQTTARSTLQRLLKQHGEGHVILLLRTFVETTNDNARIDSFALQAISGIMLCHPEWVDTGLRWFDVVDRIDFAEIQRHAKVHRNIVPQREGIASALLRELADAFAADDPVTPAEKTEVPENDLLYGMTAIARYLEISRTKCQYLVERNLLPTFRMPGSTTRCARKSSLNARWQALEEAATTQPTASTALR
jgi:hypothetical protein